MTITLYKINDDRKTIKKTVDTSTKIADITGSIKTDCDVLHPVFELSYNVNYMTCNYLYVPAFHRYYFVDPPKLSAQRIYLECHVDALKSYQDQILNLNCVVARQENISKAQNYLNDGIFRILQYREYVPFKFKAFEGSSYVLAAAGEFTNP